MYYTTDPKATRGVITFYPNSDKERKLIMELYESMKASLNVQLEFDEKVECKRPPIGIKPKCIHNTERINEIRDAMRRYDEAGYIAPKEWWNELMDLYEDENKRLLKRSETK